MQGTKYTTGVEKYGGWSDIYSKYLYILDLDKLSRIGVEKYIYSKYLYILDLDKLSRIRVEKYRGWSDIYIVNIYIY